MRTRLISAILVVVSTCVALGLVEAALRIRGLYRPPSYPIQPAQPGLYTADATVGYRLRPHLRTVIPRRPSSTESVPLVANSDGFRSHRDLGEADGRPKVLVVGDSFVFGAGVRADDRLTEQLELLEPRWRVDNLGMAGWGIDLMIRAIEQYGRKADPDVVVLAIYTDDFRRVLPSYAGAGFAYPKFELEAGALVTRPYSYPNAFERLRLVQFVYQETWDLRRNRYDLNDALLERFLNSAAEIGFRPVIVFFPGTGDTEEDRERRGFLARWTARRQVPYRDLTDVIRKAGVDNVYIRGDSHWNEAGHRLAAGQLKELLDEVVPAFGFEGR